MWICMNDGFISVVSDKNDSTRLMVRARRKEALLNLFGPDVVTIENAGSDYRWRTFVDRKSFASLIASRLESINYTNFKNSVREHDLHNLYMDFWGLHRDYQDKEDRGATRSRKHQLDA